jgi:hypothetical protein
MAVVTGSAKTAASFFPVRRESGRRLRLRVNRRQGHRCPRQRPGPAAAGAARGAASAGTRCGQAGERERAAERPSVGVSWDRCGKGGRPVSQHILLSDTDFMFPSRSTTVTQLCRRCLESSRCSPDAGGGAMTTSCSGSEIRGAPVLPNRSPRGLVAGCYHQPPKARCFAAYRKSAALAEVRCAGDWSDGGCQAECRATATRFSAPSCRRRTAPRRRFLAATHYCYCGYLY